MNMVTSLSSLLEGTSAVVTGSASGIGKKTAMVLAESGCRVIACDINSNGLDSLTDEARGVGIEIIPWVLNITKIDDIERFTNYLTAQKETVQILVNSAGICAGTAIEEVSEDEWDKIFSVNLKGLFFLCQKMIPLLKMQSWGRIINISSLAGFVGGILSSPAYSSSKAGVSCLTKTLAKYLAKSGVTVNEVSPGTADTQMTRSWLGSKKMDTFIDKVPLGRLAKPSDIANAILFLTSPFSDFITGQVLHVNGGMYMP